jgi:hypothetical protein
MRDSSIIDKAKAGDFGPLRKVLSGGAPLSSPIRRLVLDIIDGKLKRPRHRPPSRTTVDERRKIARRSWEIEALVGKSTAAVAEVATEFGCSETKVHLARRQEKTWLLKNATLLGLFGDEESLRFAKQLEKKLHPARK